MINFKIIEVEKLLAAEAVDIFMILPLKKIWKDKLRVYSIETKMKKNNKLKKNNKVG